jgi:hypothetical protein
MAEQLLVHERKHGVIYQFRTDPAAGEQQLFISVKKGTITL